MLVKSSAVVAMLSLVDAVGHLHFATVNGLVDVELEPWPVDFAVIVAHFAVPIANHEEKNNNQILVFLFNWEDVCACSWIEKIYSLRC